MVSEPNFGMSDFESENKKDKHCMNIKKINEKIENIFKKQNELLCFQNGT